MRLRRRRLAVPVTTVRVARSFTRNMAPFVGGAALPRGAVGGGMARRGPDETMGRSDVEFDVVLRAARRAGESTVELHDDMMFYHSGQRRSMAGQQHTGTGAVPAAGAAQGTSKQRRSAQRAGSKTCMCAASGQSDSSSSSSSSSRGRAMVQMHSRQPARRRWRPRRRRRQSRRRQRRRSGACAARRSSPPRARSRCRWLRCWPTSSGPVQAAGPQPPCAVRGTGRAMRGTGRAMRGTGRAIRHAHEIARTRPDHVHVRTARGDDVWTANWTARLRRKAAIRV